jgi:histidyl-tRNA synthetase
LEVVAALRFRGKSVQFSYKRASLAKQLKAAASLGAKYCVILGEETTNDGLVTAKNMANGKQTRLLLEKFLAEPDQALEQ